MRARLTTNSSHVRGVADMRSVTRDVLVTSDVINHVGHVRARVMNAERGCRGGFKGNMWRNGAECFIGGEF